MLRFDFKVSDHDWFWFDRLYNKAADKFEEHEAARRAQLTRSPLT
jgi:hypothetical protein